MVCDYDNLDEQQMKCPPTIKVCGDWTSPGSVEGVGSPEGIECITQASSCHPYQVTGLVW